MRMLRRLTVFVAALCLIVPLGMLAAESAARKTQSKKKTTARKPAAPKAAVTAKAPPSRNATATRKRSASKPAAKSTSKKRTATTWRNRQTVPTPDRYKEIQEALSARGYLDKNSIDGTWNAESVEALRRFQSDQHLEPTGKINSLSLIALGLGPKRETLAALPPGPRAGGN